MWSGKAFHKCTATQLSWHSSYVFVRISGGTKRDEASGSSDLASLYSSTLYQALDIRWSQPVGYFELRAKVHGQTMEICQERSYIYAYVCSSAAVFKTRYILSSVCFATQYRRQFPQSNLAVITELTMVLQVSL